MNLFNESIESWEDWGNIFQSKKAFMGLVAEIMKIENLTFEETRLENTYPGTNAVFRYGNLIIKIFTPKESGLNGKYDYEVELSAMEAANSFGVECPKVIASGKIDDKYRFYYIVMERFSGDEIFRHQDEYSKIDKIRIAREIRGICDKLNQKSGAIKEIDLIERVSTNERLKNVPKSLADNLIKTAKAVDMSDKVLVHGDITGDNVLVDDNGNIQLIDFADSCIAPKCYELVATTFELFRCERDYIDEFKGDMDIEIFADELMNGLALHDFGADIIKEFCERYRYDINEMKSLNDVRQAFLEVTNKS